MVNRRLRLAANGYYNYLRKTYPRVGNSVISCNSAYGAMGVQGMALAMRLRSFWPKIGLNETHPKVLVYSLTGEPYRFTADLVQWAQEQVGKSVEIRNSDELDALLSAVVTWRSLSGEWETRDLMNLSRTAKLLMPAGRVNYWWPAS